MPIRSITGVLSVGIVSAGNFLVSFLLINFSTESDYGVYVFIFSGLMLAASIQNAVVCTPMSISAAKMEESKRNNFVSSILTAQLIIFIVAILLACVTDFVFLMFNPDKLFFNIGSIVFLFSTFLFREFLRVRGYLYREATSILFGDVIHFVLNATMLAVFTIIGLNISLVITSLCVANSLYLIIETKRSGVRPSMDKHGTFHALGVAWQRGGNWSFPGVLATWTQNNAFLYLSGLLLSVEATAMLAATRLLLMPINIMASGLNSVYKPIWAQRVGAELSSVANSTRNLCISICMLLALYLGALALGWNYVVIYAFGGKFQTGLDLLLLWGVVFLLQTLRSRESNMLQLLEEFKYLTLIGVPASLICLVISTASIFEFGVSGALYGIILSEVIMIILFYKRWNHK